MHLRSHLPAVWDTVWCWSRNGALPWPLRVLQLWDPVRQCLWCGPQCCQFRYWHHQQWCPFQSSVLSIEQGDPELRGLRGLLLKWELPGTPRNNWVRLKESTLEVLRYANWLMSRRHLSKYCKHTVNTGPCLHSQVGGVWGKANCIYPAFNYHHRHYHPILQNLIIALALDLSFILGCKMFLVCVLLQLHHSGLAIHKPATSASPGTFSKNTKCEASFQAYWTRVFIVTPTPTIYMHIDVCTALLWSSS